MLFHRKTRKAIGIIWTAVSVLIIASMIALSFQLAL